MAAVRAGSGSSATRPVGLVCRAAVVERRICMATCTACVGLVLPLILEHQADQRGRLVAGAAASAAEHGVGQLVQAELVHLAGEPDLGLGIEPQAEEPLGRLPGALDVARVDRQPQRQLLAPPAGVKLSSGWTASTSASASA